jgi:hypothetical protein
MINRPAWMNELGDSDPGKGDTRNYMPNERSNPSLCKPLLDAFTMLYSIKQYFKTICFHSN